MSSAASPEETPVEDASTDHADGGSSNSLTQGEIIFVTLLSFVVLLACILGTYALCRRHQKQKQQIDQKDDAQRLTSDGQGTDIVDIEASGSLDHQGGDAENGKIIPRETSQHPVSGGPLLRRASVESNRNVKKMKIQGSRRATMDGEGSRHANMGALGSNVSSRYKHAAIEHMNQISQTGRHESSERRGTL